MELLYAARGEMRGRVGMVVPAWFPASTLPEAARAFLRTTLAGAAECVRPGDLVLVTDGCPGAAEAARAVREELARAWGEPFHLLELPENRGKGAALAAGIGALLGAGEAPLAWIATRDADGDHFLDDLPHLYRLGEQVAEEQPGTPVLVIGRRSSVHAPLGWVRGEYELLLNEVLVEALAFALARAGRAWDTRYLAAHAPDLQSGYKLYNRGAAAQAVASLEREAAAHPDLDLLRTGMEVVPFVEVALGGGVFAEAERKTFFDQPVTSYGSAHLPRFYGGKLAWALARCGVPAAQAAILLDGALIRRPLYTDPKGRESLLEMRRAMLETLGGVAAGEPAGRRFL